MECFLSPLGGARGEGRKGGSRDVNKGGEEKAGVAVLQRPFRLYSVHLFRTCGEIWSERLL